MGTLSNKINDKHSGKAGHPAAFTECEEASFVSHIKSVALWGFPFDMLDLRVLAQTYLNSKGRIVKQFRNNLPSAEWAGSFPRRHKSEQAARTCQNIKRARTCVSAKTVSAYFNNLEQTLKDGEEIPPSNLFNYDETNLSDNPGVKNVSLSVALNMLNASKITQKRPYRLCIVGQQQGICCHVMSYINRNTYGQRGQREHRPELASTELEVVGLMRAVSATGLKVYSFKQKSSLEENYSSEIT